MNKKSTKFTNLIDSIMELSLTNRHDFKYVFMWHMILLVLLLGNCALVYILGGTSNAIYVMCIPIFVAAFLIGPFRSIIIATIAGFLVGPFMPYDVANGIMQRPLLWEKRIVFYIVVALIVGELANYIKKMHEINKLKSYENFFTGYPNFNKWKYDYNRLCEEYPEKTYCMILFEFENFDTISRLTDYELSNQTSIELLNRMAQYFTKSKIYSITNKKFLTMIENDNLDEVVSMANIFSQDSKKPIYIHDIPVAAVLKGGIDCFLLANSNANHVMNHLGKALIQSHRLNQNITIYSDEVAIEIQEYYNILLSIYHSLQEDAFYLVFQPKINIENDEIQGVEALLRWNNETYRNVPISKVIQIAEEAGFITYITKWVIKNAVIQLKNWQDHGKKIKIAINISAKDLYDDTLLDFLNDIIAEYQIDPSYIEFELTERSLVENQEFVFHILSEIRKLGIEVSLDDYGTGYNSLMYLVKILFKFDYVKIDKVFIDEIENTNTQILIKGIINLAQELGIKIIAEGVESEKQLNILREMNCDIIQGYFYSKPLRPMELSSFIEDRKIKNVEN